MENDKNDYSQIEIASSLRKRIIETLTDGNRVTVVVGGTGCGKSTLVPQLILEEFGKPILCTQPRRLAVVAVSTHVARQRGSKLGDEVGYHVGQDRVASSTRTQLLFATAGILLEELKSNGVEALTKYKVVLIDECHERSPESDLCLVLIKTFLTKYPHANIRIILMSATFNQGKYTDYFHNVPGCEIINTISLETAQSLDAFYNQVQMYYLEHILQSCIPYSVRRTGCIKQFERTMRLDPESEMYGEDGGKSLSSEILIIIQNLVNYLHKQEPMDAKFLIFAPTYRHLEQIYSQLSGITLDSNFDSSDSDSDSYYEDFHEYKRCDVLINVLHSSIDLEDCLQSMNKTEESNTTATFYRRKRHILLASAIADSSVTIPNVTCVIDTCRSLQVKWDAKAEKHDAKTVWTSKSICAQRRGRTGRTNAGRVYRLVHRDFYISRLENWDQPQIELSSCRSELLALLSSSSNKKIFANPQGLLRKALDPPPDLSVQKAIQYLQDIGACVIGKTTKNKDIITPTHLGKLLASLPYSVENSEMIVRGAKKGKLHEALVLVSILNTRPYPILHVFGDNDKNEYNQRQFYDDVNPKDRKSVAVANFAAYLFWYMNWKTNIYHELGRWRFLHCTGCTDDMDMLDHDYLEHPYNTYHHRITNAEVQSYDCNVWEWNEKMSYAHSQWCRYYDINPTSVRAIDANVDLALKTLYHKDHEPVWLRYQTSASKWSTKPKTNHEDGIFCDDIDIFRKVYGYKEGIEICNVLLELQDPSDFSLLEQSTPQNDLTEYACIHFLKGKCLYGDKCKNLHSYDAPRPPCKFFSQRDSCTNQNCLYSHQPLRLSPRCISVLSNSMETPPVHSFYEGGILAWFTNRAPKMLLFGEGDFSFTNALHELLIHPSQSTCIHDTYDDGNYHTTSLARTYCTMMGVDATRCHIHAQLKQLNHLTTCVWNYPFTGEEEDDDSHISLMSGTFLSVAFYLKMNIKQNSCKIGGEFALTLQGDQFCRWSVLESAQRAGFYLDWWDEFDYSEFPGYHPMRENGERFPAQNSRFYVFRLEY